MTLEYYLLCKREYENIINCLVEIINSYNKINQIIDKNIYMEPDVNLGTDVSFFINKLNETKILKKECEKHIGELCDHKFVEDLIEIGPETSKYITYCEICETTK